MKAIIEKKQKQIAKSIEHKIKNSIPETVK